MSEHEFILGNYSDTTVYREPLQLPCLTILGLVFANTEGVSMTNMNLKTVSEKMERIITNCKEVAAEQKIHYFSQNGCKNERGCISVAVRRRLSGVQPNIESTSVLCSIVTGFCAELCSESAKLWRVSTIRCKNVVSNVSPNLTTPS